MHELAQFCLVNTISAMTTVELMQTFAANHNTVASFICSLSDDEFVHRHDNKWSAGQQLSHLLLCLIPISQALGSGTYIREKFGTLDREQMNYDQLIAFYKEGLLAGGKAPERFLPAIVYVNQKQELHESLTGLLSTIQQQINGYSEAELDSLVLPHPFLGSLSIRELLYLMSYHPLHHLAQVKANLEVRYDI